MCAVTVYKDHEAKYCTVQYMYAYTVQLVNDFLQKLLFKIIWLINNYVIPGTAMFRVEVMNRNNKLPFFLPYTQRVQVRQYTYNESLL